MNAGIDKMAEENVPAPTRTDAQLDTKTGAYIFQRDELWFNLNADLRPNALGITPEDSAHPFVPPPDGDLVTDFVNNLGYPEELHFVSKMYVNSLYQSWRTILSMINQCLTGKTFGNDKPRHPVLQMLWGIITGTNVPTKKPKPPVIPYYQFTKLIIYYLGVDTIFTEGPNYYKKYLEMAARKPRQPTTMTGEEVEKKKKALKAGKSKQPSPAKQPKPMKKKTSKPTPSKKNHKGKRSNHLVDEEDEEGQPASEPQVENDEYNLQRGIQMSLESLQTQGQVRQAPIDGVAIHEPDSVITQKLPDVKDNGKCIVSDVQAAQSLLDLQKRFTQPKDDTSANVVHDTSSLADSTNDAKTVVDMEQSNSETDTEILNVEEEQGKEVSNTVALEETTIELDEGQARSNPGDTEKSNSEVDIEILNVDEERGKKTKSNMVAQRKEQLNLSKVKLINPDFIATVYPQVHESLKQHLSEVYLEIPPSSSGTLSSMKNLDDTFGDQFLNDKSPEDEPGKANVETEVESMDKTIKALGSRVYTLENHDLYPKIDKQVNETVKEVVHDALQAPLLDRFRDLSEVQMKEILCDQMFESGSYRSHPDHSSLYQALEVSIEWDNREEFIEEKVKSRKRRRDDQDPPPPPPKDSDHSKKKRRDSDASASQQPQVQQSSAWKTSDTREATVQKSSSSSKQKQASPSA
ncbi:hypothetical protein Tco_0287455 [Tanacetum coccineum]